MLAWCGQGVYRDMERFYYADSLAAFAQASDEAILGALAAGAEFPVLPPQRDAWQEQIVVLRRELAGVEGALALEYSVPRMGSRIDAILIIENCVFVMEFKVGAKTFDRNAIDQVYDYALDLHYFHEPSHYIPLVPMLIATAAEPASAPPICPVKTLEPRLISAAELRRAVEFELLQNDGVTVDPAVWLGGRYSPTPTIVEAASALYRGHTVDEITRSDAAGEMLRSTSTLISQIIADSRVQRRKSICFVTGVPGAGKTLVGLNVANEHVDETSELYSVFLSGNGPLVRVLREALARDAVVQAVVQGKKFRKGDARSRVKQFIQNVHHFRDECLRDPGPPIEHVTLFDEAQRAWNVEQTRAFMQRKRKRASFDMSEPQFLISCLDRHRDWATIVCLVGGGQEINTGEGGIREWFSALEQFPDWRVFASSRLEQPDFDPGPSLDLLEGQGRFQRDDGLHLSVSMRSFRAENVSNLIRCLLDCDEMNAKGALTRCLDRYAIRKTRRIDLAKEWLQEQARGTERYGILASSAAERLRPQGIHVRAPVDPVHWFLDSKEDVRSSYYLEDVASEFHIQGLELDWVCVTWDADFRYDPAGWQHYRFVGSQWNRIRSEERKRYQKNAYRVLLTRARQGKVIVVPEGDGKDPTRLPEYYDPTYAYLRNLGIPSL